MFIFLHWLKKGFNITPYKDWEGGLLPLKYGLWKVPSHSIARGGLAIVVPLIRLVCVYDHSYVSALV